MNSGNNLPKAPDPNVTARAQTGSNQSTAMFEQMLNMQDQRTPYGSVTWQPSGTWTYVDPQTHKTVQVPKFMASQVLSDAQQGLLNQQQQFDARYNQMALDQAAQIKDTLSKPFNYTPGQYEQWAGGLYDKLNQPNVDRNRSSLEQQLANRGLNFGTENYDQAMKDFYEGNQRARDEFMLNSYGTGLNTALTIRNQPLKEGIALMGAGQITEPTWISGPQSGVAPTDVAGITQNAYNQQLARAQTQQQQSAGIWGALGQIGGSALGGWLGASDERVKHGLQRLGTDPQSGLPVKRWAYDGESETHETPTAQDVQKEYPDAVRTVNGVKMVDWSRVPGGEKYAPQTKRNVWPGGGRPLNSRTAPDAKTMKGRDMTVPQGDPYNNVNDIPHQKYQEARGGKRRGLQQLGKAVA